MPFGRRPNQESQTMSSVAVSQETSSETRPTSFQSIRETVESIVVAFILAFLFRAFVAEAFVIPTGSMAPTLMGAHKDLTCTHCGQAYQAGASSEFDANTGAFRDLSTISSTCSVCRAVNAYDLRDNPNHKSFSGDRILVSKFDYILHKPERWDVFVFKYHDNARMNYIKRLVGLPGEQLLIRDGDVYLKSTDAPEWTIARKPPHKIKAMRQIVADTEHQPAVLVEQGWPSAWQPLEDQAAAWAIEQAPGRWSAELKSSEAVQWLRYYHNFVSEGDWIRAYAGEALPIAPPKTARLITDYLAYNSSMRVDRSGVYGRDGRLLSDIQGDRRALDLEIQSAKEWLSQQGMDTERLNDVLDEYIIGPRIHPEPVREDGTLNDGLHWVGDLTGEFVVDVQSESGTLLLDLVEFGLHLQCSIDVSTGQATLAGFDNEAKIALFDGAETAIGQTKVRGAGSYRVEFANVDDQLVLWVNGSVVSFDRPTSFDSNDLRQGDARRPYWTEADPLDAAPVGIGGQGINLTVRQARVYRDIYYIAIRGKNYSDFDLRNESVLRATIPEASERSGLTGSEAIAEVYSHPQWWSQTKLFSMRSELPFELDEGQYFPMGDNSAASSDARAWTNHHYVEEKYLLGKALLVFWPHTWNSPIPFTPNFGRMGLIR